MKTHPKLKSTPRPLFSCGFFGHCTQSVVSPTTPHNPSLHLPPPPPSAPESLPPHPPPPASDPTLPPSSSSSSSSSSSTSQSFTQWRFPIQKPPFSHDLPPESVSETEQTPEPASEPNPPIPPPPPMSSSNMAELFHVAELQLTSGVDDARISTLQLLEKKLVPNPLPEGGGSAACPTAVMVGVVGCLNDASMAKAATKVLLALCLAEENRRVAVEAGAVAEVVETLAGLEGTAVERALAALELLCTLPEGAAELRSHALSVPVLVEMVAKTAGRGKECAISVLAAMFGCGEGEPPPPVVAQAVLLALQGECSARGRRKGTQLLKALEENGRLDLTEEGS
ncbi:U-box domain-containing protein 26 [Cinnamomum micranthum f. kanehirae]|uniref:U-box domain-containing protein 26 n=1 Tax=Cinnamomum micranthum f. kanehirae TaxID=337451 RepID=A0A3S3N083_9MAGN|nr:U-box domain-containing protein 26 [Cinnamomum micranthum f. kanehirae]